MAQTREKYDPDWEYKRYMEHCPPIQIVSADFDSCAIWIPELKRRVECNKSSIGITIYRLSDFRERYSPCSAEQIGRFFRHECKTGTNLRRRISEAASTAMNKAYSDLRIKRATEAAKKLKSKKIS